MSELPSYSWADPKLKRVTPEISNARWRTVYVVTVVYGALTLVALWLFTRAYAS